MSRMLSTEFLIGRTAHMLYGPWWSFCFVVVVVVLVGLFSLNLPRDHVFSFMFLDPEVVGTLV